MKLLAPTTFQPSLLLDLPQYSVESLYGALSGEPGARAKQWLPSVGEEAAAAHIEQARAAGMGFVYTINASCTANREFTAQGQRWLAERLGWLVEVAAEAVVCTNPYLIEMVKNRYPELKANVSTIAGVDSVGKALFYENLGVDAIYLPEYLNRDFRLLKAIRSQVGCELVLTVNLGCPVHCAIRGYHANFISHASESLDQGCYVDYSLAKCNQIKASEPVEMMKSSWIRPEDLATYEALGYHKFKLAGREEEAEWIVRAVKAYAGRKYAGMLSDILIGMDGVDPFGRFPLRLDNSRLDGFLDFFARKDCRLGCRGCDHCENWLARAVVAQGDGARYGEGIQTVLRQFVSGSFRAPAAGGRPAK